MFRYIFSLIIAIFILNAQEFENDLRDEISLKNLRKYTEADAPSSSIAFLVQDVEVVIQKNKCTIEHIRSLCLLNKVEPLAEYLACTMKSCFVID